MFKGKYDNIEATNWDSQERNGKYIEDQVEILGMKIITKIKSGIDDLTHRFEMEDGKIWP